MARSGSTREAPQPPMPCAQQSAFGAVTSDILISSSPLTIQRLTPSAMDLESSSIALCGHRAIGVRLQRKRKGPEAPRGQVAPGGNDGSKDWLARGRDFSN